MILYSIILYKRILPLIFGQVIIDHQFMFDEKAKFESEACKKGNDELELPI